MKDLKLLEDLQDKQAALRRIFKIVENIEGGNHVDEEDYQKVINAGSPTGNSVSRKIIANEAKMEQLEETMEARRAPGYETSPTPSESGQVDLHDTVESGLPIVFLLFTEAPICSILCIFYKLYKLDLFKILRSYYFS